MNFASPITLLFVGDVMLGRLVNEVLRDSRPDYVWGDTLPVFKTADVRICNLECVLSDKGSPWSLTPKIFHFRSNARNIATLKTAEIDAVSLANNHSLDFGYDALAEMIQVLDQAGIHHAGAGMTYEEASQPAFFTISGIRFGLISFTDNEPSWEASEDCPGVLYVPIQLNDFRATRLFELVAEAKRKVDFLIVAAHWGPNWGSRPRPEHIAFAKSLLDSGADLIFGHSCHVFQGIEIRENKVILYSCGDFVDDYAVDPVERNDQSFIFLVEIEGHGAPSKIFRTKLFPTVIRNFQAQRARGTEAKKLATKIKELCAELNPNLDVKSVIKIIESQGECRKSSSVLE